MTACSAFLARLSPFPAAATLCLLLSLLTGCPREDRGLPTLYVVNGGNDTVAGFTAPAELGGNRRPEALLSGPQTLLEGVTDVAVDASGAVYALNSAAATVTVYPDPLQRDGNVSPVRVALLGSVANAYSGMAMAGGGQTLRVMFTPTNQTLLFPSPSAASFDGPVSASALSVTLAGLDAPVAIHERGRVYIADAGSQTVFHATLDAVHPIGSDAFTDVRDLYVDGRDVLYVVNGALGGNTVAILRRAVTLTGEVDADAVLTVLGAVDLAGIVVGSDGTAYLADEGAHAVYVYRNLALRRGLQFPDRTLQGMSTALDAPRRLALYEP